MRVLLDTNIVVHREGNKASKQDIGTLFYWIDRLRYTKCIHPLTIEELNRHADPAVVSTMNVKINSYHLLKTEAPIHAEVARISRQLDRDNNDLNDTKLVNAIYCDRVDILVTEDKKIHRKAALLGVSAKVFKIDAFLEKAVAENPALVDYSVLAVKKEYFGNINLADGFFDSLREDYAGFDQWFNKKAKEEDHAYVCFEANALAAFLYLKVEGEDENYSRMNPPLPPGKRLKVGTLKVVSNGFKLGERFLKIVFDNARKFKCREIYVTIFNKRPEQKRLINMLEDWGFVYHGTNTSTSGEEKVFVRDFSVKANKDAPKKTFPWLSKEARAFIVPIRPEYHTELFPDSILNTESKLEFVENQPHRNAIRKAYISHSLQRDLQSGDIIVFYRSGGIYKGVATTIGIVENTLTDLKNVDELIEACRKRTVLTDSELREYWDWKPKNRPFVINFLYAFSFRKRITLKEMLDTNILDSMDAVRTINLLSLDSLKALIKRAGI